MMMFPGDSTLLQLSKYDLQQCLHLIHQKKVLHCDLRRPNLLHFPPFKHYVNGKSFIVDFGEAVILQPIDEEGKLVKFGMQDSRQEILHELGRLTEDAESIVMDAVNDLLMLGSICTKPKTNTKK